MLLMLLTLLLLKARLSFVLFGFFIERSISDDVTRGGGREGLWIVWVDFIRILLGFY